MALMNRQGAGAPLTAELNTTVMGGASVPPDNTAPDTNTPVTTTDVLQQIPAIQNEAFSQTAVDVGQYPQSYGNLIGYMAGHRLSVTYFLSTDQPLNIRTNNADSPIDRNSIHSAWTRINNYEITLTEPWAFDYDQTLAQASVTGLALLYPGLNPKVGDIFLTESGDGVIAEFKVSQVRPMSWRNQRIYQISFFLYGYPSTDDVNNLATATVSNVNFDKVNFLSNTASLLSTSQYSNLKILRQMRIILAQYYFRTFLDPHYNSFFRPIDNVYDPYLTRYMANQCSYDVVKQRPLQLWSNVDKTYEHTIWARLEDRLNLVITDVWANYGAVQYSPQTMDVFVTGLTNQQYVKIQNPNPYVPIGSDPTIPPVPVTPGIPYVFSVNFYAGNTVLMTPWELYVYTAINTRQLTNSTAFIQTYLNGYQSLDTQSQFYFIPIYLFLIDLALGSIAVAPT